MTEDRDEIVVAPARLLAEGGPMASMLRAGGQPEPVDAAEGFAALRRAQKKQESRRRYFAMGALAAVVVLAFGTFQNESERQLRLAEPESVAAPASTPFEAQPNEAAQERADTTPATEPEKEPVQEGEAASKSLPVHAKVSNPSAPLEPAEVKPAPVENCGRLSGTDHQAALECYRRVSQGTGIAAELAYLERARINRRTLGDSDAALRTLSEYRARFPQGALAEEALLARTDVLASVGRTEEAATEIDRVLGAGQRSRKLLIWRAQLAGRLDDCQTVVRLDEEVRRSGNAVEALLPIVESCR